MRYHFLKFFFIGLQATSQIIISSLSDLESELTKTNDSLQVELTGNHSLSTPINVPENVELLISSNDGAQITCVNETYAFDVLHGAALKISDVHIRNCSGSAIRTQGSVLNVSNCVFEDNTNASFGGAIYSEDSDVSVDSTLFIHNVANQGGSVYILSEDKRSAFFQNCTFLNNSANEVFSSDYSITFPFFTGGGAIAVQNIDLDVTRSRFTGNHATQSGGGIAISENSSLVVSYSEFDSNTAIKFGAGLAGPNMDIQNSLFINNTCDQDGGGIYTWGTSELESILCDDNTALDKGGCLYTRGKTVLGTNVTMTRNTGYFGGSVYAAFGSEVEVHGGYYANSTATRNGGFMYVSDGGYVEMYNGTVEYCFAVRRAGIVYVSGTSGEVEDGLGGGRLHIHDGIFRHNSVDELGGGFVIWGESTSFIISGGIYSDNYSLYAGGVLYLEQFATFEASNCTFENNLSDDQGGAIYAREPNYISVSCLSINNQSPQASYIYITNSIQTSYINNSTITDSVSGSSDVLYIADSVVEIDNVHMKGDNQKAQTIAIKQNKDSEVTITKSSFRGWYGESIVSSLNTRDNTTHIIECDFRDTFSFYPVLSQSKVLIVNAFVNNNTLLISEDLASIDVFTCEDYEICDECIDSELGVLCTCSPIQCHLGNQLEIAINSSPNRTIYYPEVLKFDMEITNDDNESVIWNLEKSSNTSSPVEIVPESGIIKPGDCITINVEMPQDTGTFESSFTFTGPLITENTVIPVTHTLYRCNMFEIEVTDNDDVICTPCVNFLEDTNGEIGYDCERDGVSIMNLPIKPGFWRSSDTSLDILKCNFEDSCKGGSHIQNSDSYCEEGNMGPLCAVCERGYNKDVTGKCIKCGRNQAGLISVGIIVSLVFALLVLTVFLFLIDRLSYITSFFKCREHCSNRGQRNNSKIKTFANHSHKLKIIVVVWQILVVFPEIVNISYPERYSTFLKWMKLCMTFSSFNIDFLSSSCIIPSLNHYSTLLAITITPLFLVVVLMGTYFLSKKINKESQATWTRHISIGLIISFLIFTSTSTAIFKTFVCDTNVLPDRGFLRSDYSIECFTLEHTLYRVYAGVMIFFYPLGIPFLYFVLLYKNRDILQRQDHEAKKANDEVSPYRFLWKDFKPNMYFYEVIECMRRILLTGFLVFVKPGSSTQVSIACLFAFISLGIFELVRPHHNNIDTWLYRVGCIVIFLSSYMGLLLKIEYEQQQPLLEILLILLNIGLVIAVFSSIVLGVYAKDHDIMDIVSIVKKRNSGKSKVEIVSN